MPKLIRIVLTSAILLCAYLQPAQAGWSDWLQDLVKPAEDAPASAPATANFSQEQLNNALRQALNEAVRYAVQLLGREDGFLSNPQVKIPVPDRLSWADKGLRTLGQGALVDDFERAMNRAAEQAVPEVLDIFQDSLRTMSLDDAEAILRGPDDAATQYFRRTSATPLRERIQPIITQHTADTAVTARYKAVMQQARALGPLVSTESLDLDRYVTDGALEGLFFAIAEQEKRVRADPLTSGTDLVRKVFDAYLPR